MIQACYPYKPYMVLEKTGWSLRALATAVIWDFHHQPCIMDPWWYEHVKRFKTPSELLSQDSLQRIAAFADFAEGENVSSECNNAHIRKHLMRAVQCRYKDIEDMSALWVIQQEIGVDSGIFGDGKLQTHVSGGPKNKKSCGGGRCRAFVSKMSSMYKLPNGRTDFATIMKLYMEELQKDDSEILRECEARGRQATEANREFNQHRAGTAGRPMSSFGHIHKTAAASVSQQHKVSKLVDDLEAQSQVASNAGSSNDASQTLELALNSMTPLQFIVQNGGQLRDQLQAIRNMGRELAMRATAAQRKIDEDLRTRVTSLQPAFSSLHRFLSQCVGVRAIPLNDVSLSVRPQMSVATESHARITALNKKMKGTMSLPLKASALDKHWIAEHKMSTDDGCPDLPAIPPGYRPTYCWSHGGGTCVCSGVGHRRRLAKAALSSELTKLTQPKNSQLRQDLKAGKFVIHLDGFWLHIAIMYLNPRRPTFVQMELMADRIGGRRVVRPKLDESGRLKCLTDIEAMSLLDLTKPLDVEFFKFVVLKKSLSEFCGIDRLLLEHIDGMPESVRWWRAQPRQALLFSFLFSSLLLPSHPFFLRHHTSPHLIE